MSEYQFGVGYLFGRRTDITPATPVELGVLQDIQLDFKQDIKELMGQYKVAVDAAQGMLKITMKAKAARIQSDIWNNLFFGQTQTIGSGQVQMSANEIAAISASVTVANATTFVEDLGVKISGPASTGKGGFAFEKVASAPAAGQYSVVETGGGKGVYSFNATDVTSAYTMSFNYTYTSASTLYGIAIANQLMGSGPAFEMHLGQSYKNNAGQLATPYYKFNACKASGLSVPFKNGDYLVYDVDFQAFADSSGNIGTIVTQE